MVEEVAMRQSLDSRLIVEELMNRKQMREEQKRMDSIERQRQLKSRKRSWEYIYRDRPEDN